MGSLLSTVKQKTSPSATNETTAFAMGSSSPETFKHYANAQTEFTKTLPLIGNENAFLGDIFSSFVLSSPTPPRTIPLPLSPPKLSSNPPTDLPSHAATAKTTPSPRASTVSNPAPRSSTPTPTTR